MIALDLRTVVVLCLASYVVSTLFAAQLWRHNRGKFAGTGLWVLNFAAQALALMLITARGAIPDWASFLLANFLSFAGALLMYIGLERFVGKPSGHRHDHALLVAATAAFGYFLYVTPSLDVRNLIISVYQLAICLECVWLMWRRVEPSMRPLTFGVGLVFACYCVINAGRIANYFLGERTGNDFFQGGNFPALLFVAYLMLSILLTYALVLMVNRRLIIEIGAQKEKFSKAFHAAPYAMTLARASDGKILEVNDTFTAKSGYERAEIIGKTSTDLHLWQHAEDRAAVIAELLRSGEVKGMEQHFRNKTGDVMVGLFSAEVIAMDGERHFLSCIADITERKAAELALQQESGALRRTNEELARFNRVAVGRELEMIRLKQQVNDLAQRLGEAAPYSVGFAAAAADGRDKDVGGGAA